MESTQRIISTALLLIAVGSNSNTTYTHEMYHALIIIAIITLQMTPSEEIHVQNSRSSHRYVGRKRAGQKDMHYIYYTEIQEDGE